MKKLTILAISLQVYVLLCVLVSIKTEVLDTHAVITKFSDEKANETRIVGANDKQLKTKSPPPATIITFVNGIYHSIDDWRNISADISELFNAEVRPFYNPSSGVWVKDATRAGIDLVMRPSDQDLAKGLANHLRLALNDVEPKGRVLHLAHSGGAILTYLAAKHHLTTQETSRIDIVTFGAGKSITRKYFKGRVYNYYARNDPLTIVDKRTNQLIKRVRNHTYHEIRDHKHNTTFVFLAPQANHPIVDHSMLGPTYRYAMALEAEQFKDRLKMFLMLKAKEKDVIRLLRKQAANATGFHHFWDWQVYGASANMFRRVRKFSANVTKKRGYFSKKYVDDMKEKTGTLSSVFFQDEILFSFSR